MGWDDDDDAGTDGPRPCERCGAGASSIDSMQAAQYAMCREMLMGANRPGWLCFDCRKKWLRIISRDAAVGELINVELEYDVWRAKMAHPAVLVVNFVEGHTLIAKLRAAKVVLDEMADGFIGCQ